MEKIFQERPFELELPEKGGCSIGMIGSTRAGKTHCMMYLLNNYFKDNISVMMTGSSQADIYKKAPKNIIVAPQYIPRVLKDFYMLNRETNNNYKFLTVLDDIVTGVKFDREVLKLLTIYRNSNCSAIMSAQAMTLFNSAGRTNFNFMLLFKLNSDEQVERVVKAYLKSYFPAKMKMADQIRYYREATSDHFFFVIDNLNGGVYLTKCPEE